MIRLKQLRCSFCRKKESEVSKLVAGPRVYICDACVTIAVQLMDAPRNNQPGVQDSVWRRVQRIVRNLFVAGDARRIGLRSGAAS